MSRAKIRPCKKDCGYPALKGRQFCTWHHLLRQSSDVQALAAQARLALAGDPLTHVARQPKHLWPDGERWCAGCQSYVPLFYCSGSRCKACKSSTAHAKRVETIYGISAEEYDALLRKQKGRCAICRCLPRTIRLAVDHDHKTGEVRGLLCKRCNHDLLGGGHDDPLMLFRAIQYLLFPPRERLEKGYVTPGVRQTLMSFEAVVEHKIQITTPQLRGAAEPPPF